MATDSGWLYYSLSIATTMLNVTSTWTHEDCARSRWEVEHHLIIESALILRHGRLGVVERASSPLGEQVRVSSEDGRQDNLRTFYQNSGHTWGGGIAAIVQVFGWRMDQKSGRQDRWLLTLENKTSKRLSTKQFKPLTLRRMCITQWSIIDNKYNGTPESRLSGPRRSTQRRTPQTFEGIVEETWRRWHDGICSEWQR
eukprot:6490606-Amphidinium_carterae.3